jgi:hypothetical protein
VTTTEPFMTDAELQKSWPQWGPSLQRFGALVGRPKPVCLLTRLDELSLYQWHTKTAKDYFCAACGILPFRRPRTAPHVWGVNVRCVERVDLSPIPIKYVYGSRLD